MQIKYDISSLLEVFNFFDYLVLSKWLPLPKFASPPDIIKQWRIQDFPLGGTDPLWGQPPMHTLFSKNICENERN